MNGKIALRTELSNDYRATENTVREAFWNVYAPGAAEHYLLHCLRKSPDYMPRLATVAVCGDTVVGAIACAAGSIRTDAGRTLGVVTVGPLGVLPDWQHRGIGRMLLDRTAALAAMQGHSALVLCGDRPTTRAKALSAPRPTAYERPMTCFSTRCNCANCRPAR